MAAGAAGGGGEPFLGFRVLNMLALGLGWCLAMSGVFVNISTTTLAATEWEGTYASTLPIGVQIICAGFIVVPAGWLAGRIGRRPVFVGAALLGAVGGAVMIAAAYRKAYGLLILGAFLQGPSFAVAMNYRFVSAEFASTPEWRARAMSLTVGSAVFAAGLGPAAVVPLKTALPTLYAGSYILTTCLFIANALIVGIVAYGWLEKEQKAQVQRLLEQQQPIMSLAVAEVAEGSPQGPAGLVDKAALGIELGAEPADKKTAVQDGKDSNKAADLDADLEVGSTVPASPVVSASTAGAPSQSIERSESAARRTASQALLTPEFAVPAITAAVCFCTMASLMSSCPVAMANSGHPYSASTYTIEGHIIGMYLPAVIVGDWIGMVRWAAGAAGDGVMSSLILLLPPAWMLTCGVTGGGGAKVGRPVVSSSSSPSRPPYHPSAPITSTMVFGGLLMIASTGILLGGLTVGYFAAGLALIGVGWAFAYVSSSAAVISIFVKDPHLKLAVQGGMDTMVVLLSGVANIVAGVLLKAMGWENYVWLVLSGCVAMTALAAAHHVRLARRWRIGVDG